MEKFDLNGAVSRLLNPQETLDRRLFDENDCLKTEVREGLLAISDKVVKETIEGIYGLEVKDVCLTGSASNYLYREQSDIDMRIEIHNNGLKSIAKDTEHFDTFLAALMGGLHAKEYHFRFQGRLVDIKISSKEIDFVSLYSIKDNKWQIKPQKELLKTVSQDEMMAYYIKRRTEILSEFNAIKAKFKGVDLGNKLEDFYIEAVNRSIKGFPTLKDYLIFKLLNMEGILKPIGSESILAYNEALSLK